MDVLSPPAFSSVRITAFFKERQRSTKVNIFNLDSLSSPSKRIGENEIVACLRQNFLKVKNSMLHSCRMIVRREIAGRTSAIHKIPAP